MWLMPIELSEMIQASFTYILSGSFNTSEKIFCKGSGTLSVCRSLSAENEWFPQTQLIVTSLTEIHSTAKGEIGMQK